MIAMQPGTTTRTTGKGFVTFVSCLIILGLIMGGLPESARSAKTERGLHIQQAATVLDAEGQEVVLYKNSYALIIGASNYTHGWPRLPGVKDDVEEVKAALEGLAARLATVNQSRSDLDKMVDINAQLRSITLSGEKSVSRFFKLHNQFHDVFLKAAGNERLYQLNCHLMEPLKRFRLTSIAIPGRFEESVETHDEIIKVFKEKDAKKAEELVIKNVLDGGKALLAKLGKEG